MLKFVDRKAEQSRLQKALNREIAVFAVVYGRRRCGKSRLLKQVLHNNDIYFMADQSEAVQQRALLAGVIGNSIDGFGNVIYPDWSSFFENLNARLTTKITLCIDEFPYLVKNSPEIPALLQKLMENKDALKFNLVICGSSQQLMHGLVFDSAAPLFGRADEIMKINPMQVAYIQEVLNCSANEAIEEYSVWGGIPRYWELRLTEKTLFEALEYHLLTSQGILYDEPMRLFLDDMRDTVHSFTILSLVAAGCNRLSEIAARLEKPATHLSAPLEKLLMLGYIRREIPFGENPKNSKKSLYKIADPFLHFYFKYVVPNRSLIETAQSQVVSSKIASRFNEYVAEMWENLCRSAVPYLKINGIQFNTASRWWGNPKKGVEIEIDVLALSADEKYLLVGECKWNEKQYDNHKLTKELEEKAALLPFAEKKTIIPALFMKNSIKTNTENVYLAEDILFSFKQ
ncbi:MAG: ATP-binding protein [Bacteroidales bacterium]|jgi:AAA+ ATPase superfamily predicted ATPase|nr:ATP-binding protein [Bacteroidales bacterium]